MSKRNRDTENESVGNKRVSTALDSLALKPGGEDTALVLVYNKRKYHFDPKNIIFGTPKKTKNSRKLECSYRLEVRKGHFREVPLDVQTPACVTRYGLSSYPNLTEQLKPGEYRKHSINLDFDDPNHPVLRQFQEWDAVNEKELEKNTQSWLNSEKYRGEYSYMVVSKSPSTGNIHDPRIRFKVAGYTFDDPEDGKLRVGSKNVGVFGMPEEDDFGVMKAAPQLTVEDIKRDCCVRLRFRHDAIWIGQRVYSTLRATQVQIVEDPGSSEQFGFV